MSLWSSVSACSSSRPAVGCLIKRHGRPRSCSWRRALLDAPSLFTARKSSLNIETPSSLPVAAMAWSHNATDGEMTRSLPLVHPITSSEQRAGPAFVPPWGVFASVLVDRRCSSSEKLEGRSTGQCRGVGVGERHISLQRCRRPRSPPSQRPSTSENEPGRPRRRPSPWISPLKRRGVLHWINHAQERLLAERVAVGGAIVPHRGRVRGGSGTIQTGPRDLAAVTTSDPKSKRTGWFCYDKEIVQTVLRLTVRRGNHATIKSWGGEKLAACLLPPPLRVRRHGRGRSAELLLVSIL